MQDNPELNQTTPSVQTTTTPTPQSNCLPRKAVSLAEAAQIIGISYISAYRLNKRGLLQSSNALRKKVIPLTEIDRFLRETTSLAE